MQRRWVAQTVPPAAGALVEAGFASPLAELMALRGIRTASQADRYLNPVLDHLAPPESLPGLAEASERLSRATELGERILVVGDYDVDGVTSTAMLAAVLRSCGADVTTHLPRRDGEGYGLQKAHVDQARVLGCGILVALDSGTNAVDAMEEAGRRGIELIVVDHHLPEHSSQPRAMLVNPRLGTRGEGVADLTTAGLVLRLCAQILAHRQRRMAWKSLLRVACLGTIADVAPLTGDNRVIAALGLDALGSVRSPGLRALLRVSGVNGAPRASDIAFRVAPRLNAAGRLTSADEALELLLCRDESRAVELAQRLEQRNRDRQRLEKRVLAEARSALALTGDPPAVLVAWSPTWHRGVLGIAAARLAREFHRPTILLSVDGDLAVGSGRSVGNLPLHDLLRPTSGRLERFGGHAQAIGLTARADRLEELREAWQEAGMAWLPELRQPEQRYDLPLPLADVGPALLGVVDALEPQGAGNPEPIFRFGPCRLTGSPRSFGDGHLAFDVVDPVSGEVRPVVAWGWNRRATTELPEHFELLAAVERDRYRGVRLRLCDLRPGSATRND